MDLKFEGGLEGAVAAARERGGRMIEQIRMHVGFLMRNRRRVLGMAVSVIAIESILVFITIHYPSTTLLQDGLSVSVATGLIGFFGTFFCFFIPITEYTDLLIRERSLPHLARSQGLEGFGAFIVRPAFCWVFTVVTFLAPYLLYLRLSAGRFAGDPLAPILLEPRFLIFAASIALLGSVLAVGIAQCVNAKAIGVFVTVAGVVSVLCLFIFSPTLAGIHFESIVVFTITQFAKVRFAAALAGVAIALLRALHWSSNQPEDVKATPVGDLPLGPASY